MITVYLAYQFDFDASWLLGVFSSKEKALEALELTEDQMERADTGALYKRNQCSHWQVVGVYPYQVDEQLRKPDYALWTEDDG